MNEFTISKSTVHKETFYVQRNNSSQYCSLMSTGNGWLVFYRHKQIGGFFKNKRNAREYAEKHMNDIKMGQYRLGLN